ncbi:hypothetical protein [Streptomyces sp. SP17KL33]|uniref:hypothetical protein n=1 Tax=Streptomyces sp. SP17KL33 TaxID=3002534 RepID=UPI002E761458|nr:hypothetical protein [Streptomyces sp. SP17KL33]MEE1831714.1 hypothetical protein [Streptomyces sp. SP17KL33]
MSSFRMHVAAPNVHETTALLAWSAGHLADVERWAGRRRVTIPTPVLAEIRQRFAEGSGRLDPAWQRPVRPAERDEFVDALERDLRMYAASLAEGRIDDLTVTIVPGGPTACYAPVTRRLFLPDWLVETATDRLFAATPLFPEPPSATLSWLFFQSLVVDSSTGPAAHVLGIRESD